MSPQVPLPANLRQRRRRSARRRRRQMRNFPRLPPERQARFPPCSTSLRTHQNLTPYSGNNATAGIDQPIFHAKGTADEDDGVGAAAAADNADSAAEEALTPAANAAGRTRAQDTVDYIMLAIGGPPPLMANRNCPNPTFEAGLRVVSPRSTSWKRPRSTTSNGKTADQRDCLSSTMSWVPLAPSTSQITRRLRLASATGSSSERTR